jgi:hypothetical protein
MGQFWREEADAGEFVVGDDFAGGRDESRNPKSEIRNKFEIQNTKGPNHPFLLFGSFELECLDLFRHLVSDWSFE